MTLESKVTPQPKDMEQLKNEARDIINHDLVVVPKNGEKDSAESRGRAWDKICNLIDKVHLSGRKSMKVECVEGARQYSSKYIPFDNRTQALMGSAIATALKKIKP